MRVTLPAIAAATLFNFQAAAEPGAVLFSEASHQATFQLTTVADGLASPWGLDFLPDGRLIVSEWAGTIRVIDDDGASDPLDGAPAVLQYGERTGGMLDVSVHPRFASNRFVYLCYLHGTYESNVSRIARARLEGAALRNLEVIYEGDDREKEYHHSGCRMAWNEDGTMLATFGDRRYLQDASQDLSSITGTIIRINADGSVPPGNPFANHKGARPEIWAYGVRNVQGIARHPETGTWWFSEHGPLGGDEINILEPGANYGWPITTYGIEYDRTIITEDTELDGVVGPLTYWRPSTAPSGLAFYTGDDFPHWQGDLFVGSLGDRRLLRIELRGDRVLFKEALLAEFDERIRDVRMAPDGALYVITGANPGGVYRLEPVSE